jgi:hypothetical protein
VFTSPVNTKRCLSFRAELLGLLGTLLLSVSGLGGIRHDPAAKTWSLGSGSIECRLRQQNDTVYLEYLGPAGGRGWPVPGFPWKGASETAGRIEGQDLGPDDLVLVEGQISYLGSGVDQLRLTFHHRRLPLDLEVRYATEGETGVFVRQVQATNRGERLLHVESLPSLAWLLPAGGYDLDYLWDGWGQERQLRTEQLGPGARSFVSNAGRSTRMFSPWFCLRHQALGIRFLAQLAWSGNWQMQCDRPPTSQPLDSDPLRVELGIRFELAGRRTPRAGRTIEVRQN